MREALISEKIYLAGPWFTPEQMDAQVKIEALCARLGWPVFSPRLECLLHPQSSREDQRRAFFMNVHGVQRCNLVLANIEGKDLGTVWEIGAAYAYNRSLVLWSPNPDRKLNLMLAQGCDGFLAGWDAVEKFLTPIKEGKVFDWDVVQAWEREVE